MTSQSVAAVIRAHLHSQKLTLHSDGIALKGKAEERALAEVASVVVDVKELAPLASTPAIIVRPAAKTKIIHGARTKTKEIPASLLAELKLLSE